MISNVSSDQSPCVVCLSETLGILDKFTNVFTVSNVHTFHTSYVVTKYTNFAFDMRVSSEQFFAVSPAVTKYYGYN